MSLTIDSNAQLAMEKFSQLGLDFIRLGSEHQLPNVAEPLALGGYPITANPSVFVDRSCVNRFESDASVGEPYILSLARRCKEQHQSGG